MIYKPVKTSKFRKDARRCAKRGYNIDALGRVMMKLENGERLDHNIHRPHELKGTNPVETECHIESITDNWLLTYRYDGDNIVFIRTGTHSDLFN